MKKTFLRAAILLATSTAILPAYAMIKSDKEKQVAPSKHTFDFTTLSKELGSIVNGEVYPKNIRLGKHALRCILHKEKIIDNFTKMQAILKISPQKTKITLLPEEIFDTITEFTGDPLHVVWRGVTKPLHEMSKKKFTTITLKDGATNDMLTNILSHYAQFPNITTFNLGLVPTCCKYSKPNGLEQETVMEALGHNKNITTLVDQQGNEKHLHVILNPLAFFKVYPDILLDAKIFTKKEIVNTYGKNITYASLGDQYLSDDLKVDAKTLEKLPNLKSLRVWDNLNKNACDALSNYITINKNLTEIELRDIKFDKDFNITTFITSLTDASKNNKKFE